MHTSSKKERNMALKMSNIFFKNVKALITENDQSLKNIDSFILNDPATAIDKDYYRGVLLNGFLLCVKRPLFLLRLRPDTCIVW